MGLKKKKRNLMSESLINKDFLNAIWVKSRIKIEMEYYCEK